MALLTVENLAVGFNSHAVVENLNFTVNAGDYLCITGENGSGKSTLMKTLLHLQKPVSGQIRMGDGLKDTEIGYLPQQTVVQKDFPASVKEIVLSGCAGRCGMRPFYSKADKKLAAENMERMGISNLSGRCYRELSGGQQQRVLLARALCATGKILLLDEPVSGLDPMVTTEMYNLIGRLNKEGITIIMITHDMGPAIHNASHILHIGRHVFFGTRDEYLQSMAGQFFLGQESAEHTGNTEQTTHVKRAENPPDTENAEDETKAEDVIRSEDGAKAKDETNTERTVTDR